MNEFADEVWFDFLHLRWYRRNCGHNAMMDWWWSRSKWETEKVSQIHGEAIERYPFK